MLLTGGKVAASASCCCGEGSICCPEGIRLPDILWGHFRNDCGRWHWPLTRNAGNFACVDRWWGVTGAVRCRQDAMTPCDNGSNFQWGILICEGIPCTLSVACCRVGQNCDNGPAVFMTISLPLLEPKCRPFDTGDVVVSGEGTVNCALCRINSGSQIVVRVTEQSTDPWP